MQNVYLIWYGNESEATRENINYFINNIGASKWWELASTYADGDGTLVTNAFSVVANWNDTGSMGKFFNNTFNKQSRVDGRVVDRAIKANGGVRDHNGLYLVIYGACSATSIRFSLGWLCQASPSKARRALRIRGNHLTLYVCFFHPATYCSIRVGHHLQRPGGSYSVVLSLH